MIVKLGETKNLQVKEDTIDGLLLNIYIKAAAVNVAILQADFLASEVTAKVMLKRDKVNKIILQDNLQVLGLFSSLNYGVNEWINGSQLVAAGVATKAEQLRSLYLPFGGPINVKKDDELTVEFVMGRSVFAAAIDAGVSYLEFTPNYAIGYEYGTPAIKAEVIQANITKQKFSLGDNVSKIALLNYDLTTLASQAVNTVQISSDKADMSLNFYDIFNRHRSVLLPPYITPQYGGANPGLPLYPQSFTLFASGAAETQTLDNCSVDVSCNSANVAASMNYVVWISFEITQALLEKAANRRQKHVGEKLSSIA